jgi:hypothetical protein
MNEKLLAMLTTILGYVSTLLPTLDTTGIIISGSLGGYIIYLRKKVDGTEHASWFTTMVTAGFLAWIVVSILAYYGLDTSLLQVSGGIVGMLSPIIIEFFTNEERLKTLLNKIFSNYLKKD